MPFQNKALIKLRPQVITPHQGITSFSPTFCGSLAKETLSTANVVCKTQIENNSSYLSDVFIEFHESGEVNAEFPTIENTMGSSFPLVTFPLSQYSAFSESLKSFHFQLTVTEKVSSHKRNEQIILLCKCKLKHPLYMLFILKT